MKPCVSLEQIAPQRIVVPPRDADRPFYDAVLAACSAARISPTLVEMPDGEVDRMLLAVASGAGMALLPECVSERYADAGVRFVPLDGDSPVLATAIVSARHTEHLPTVAFLRAAARTLNQDFVGQILGRRMRLPASTLITVQAAVCAGGALVGVRLGAAGRRAHSVPQTLHAGATDAAPAAIANPTLRRARAWLRSPTNC